MSTLRQQLAEMQQQLDLSIQARKATHIIEKCEQVYQRTNTVAGHFALLRQTYPALQQLPSDLRVIWSDEQCEELKSAANSVNKLLSQWDRWRNMQTQAAETVAEKDVESPDGPAVEPEELAAYDIIQNDALTHCVEQVLALYHRLNRQLDAAWQNWLQTLYQHVHVEDKTLDAQRKIGKLNDIADNYVKTREKYAELIQRLPDNTDTVRRINQLADVLHQLRGMMKTDWPEEVQKFFDRINGPFSGRPTLSVLTPEVLQWLRDEKMLEDFVITRK
ncbi:hypothetical protein [Escherichia sp. E4742]|uniref:hypothetical protein n=1 Tax=Escherichia sp. E4742 TaxID=2044467 RepID=UPI00108000DC|nr:hypothetical protein [Escherichia sp. E4742]QCT88223.1 hypothetical protein FEM44_14075 [Escherichia sp. E4742]TGB54902.1 hypothetical protein CRI69_20890 [Escherichia sp. E4742]TLJ07452.1 hypothetical protein FEK62_14075 [Escherichia sp. E4742]